MMVPPTFAVIALNRMLSAYMDPAFSFEEQTSFAELETLYPRTSCIVQEMVNEVMSVIMENTNRRVTAIQFIGDFDSAIVETYL